VRGTFPPFGSQQRDRGLVVGLPQQPRPAKKIAEAYRQICYRVSRYMNQRQEVLLPDDPLVRVHESRHPR
jgi:hypothetical protein